MALYPILLLLTQRLSLLEYALGGGRDMLILSGRHFLIFKIRTQGQGGLFPKNAHEAAMQLSKLAFRSGCEFVDLEIYFGSALIAAMASGQQSF